MWSVGKIRVVITTIVVNLSSIALGTCLAWPSAIIPELTTTSINNPLIVPITNDQERWVKSYIYLGAFCSSIIGGPLGGLIGRKRSLVLGNVFFEAAFILLLAATDISMIYWGRVLQGIGAGIVCTNLPLYVGEIATDDIRGVLGSLMGLHLLGGMVYVYCLSYFGNLSYFGVNLFCLAVPVTFLVTYFMPESPYFYAAKHRRNEGIKSLMFLRGLEASEVEEEMDKIETYVNEALSRKGHYTGTVVQRGYGNALFIACFLLMLQQLTSFAVVIFDGKSIFTGAKSTLDPALAMIIIGVIQMIANLFTLYVIESTGRKAVLILSVVVMCITLFALEIFVCIIEFGDLPDNNWFPSIAFVVVKILFSFGFAPVSWVYIGEIFPMNIKSIGTSLACALAFLVGFLFTQWFPQSSSLGPHYLFLIFAIILIADMSFIEKFELETSGLSFEQIEINLQNMIIF